MLQLAVVFASIVVPLQIVVGDLHGLNTLEHQPAKIAAMEAHWESRAGAPLILFAWPDGAAEKNRFEIAIPKLGSLILRHDVDAAVTGLKEFAPRDRPSVPIPFFGFRAMVGIGMLMLAAAWTGLVLLLRGKLVTTLWYLKILPWMIPAGFVALLAGWLTTEVGRQPYIVYGLMRTADAVSAVPGASLLTTLVLFIGVYGGVFGAGVYYMARLIRSGPADVGPTAAATPSRPLSMPGESFEEPR